MAEAGSVTALLKLDTSGFDSAIKNSAEKVTQFVESMEKLGSNSDKFYTGLQKLSQGLEGFRKQLDEIGKIPSIKNFNELSTGLTKVVDSVIRFNKEGGVTVTTFTQLGNGIRSFMNALGGVDIQLTNVVNAERMLAAESNQVASSTGNVVRAVEQYEVALQNPSPRTFMIENEGISATLLNTTTSANSATTALERYNIALSTSTGSYSKGGVNFMSGLNNGAQELSRNFDKAGESAKNYGKNVESAGSSSSKMNTATRGLVGTLNTLRMTVGMVASMFLFNFAHNMMISVKNTVAAKSEMLSYLHTMGMSQAQISHFNQALDQTAERFQRINKYNIGETVANIGLEFNLSAQEMEKAMSVTSMITSEYIRAGRNADEAALAVKDIMQGELQRLSRETGVKGEDIKKAGWSGDNEDILGLMTALEKVGKSRHWDVFAEKANSLNDIVLITQNRLSEWATDMSEGVVPIVTGSFNALVNIVDKVTDFFQSLSKSLNLPDWTGTALIIGGVVTALGALVTGLIKARTNMGLLQIANQGLTQSILAAVFGIKSEELANVKATTAIKAKIFGVQSETMANQGLVNILKSKVLGLDAETVAQKGVATAIKEANAQRVVEDIASKKAKNNNVSLLQSYVSLKRGIDLSDVSGLKWHQTLAMLNPQVNKMKASNMNAIQSLRAFASSLNATRVATTLLSASIVALSAVAIGGFVLATMDSAKTMKNFNDMAENGDDKIRKVKEAFGEGSQEAKNMTEAVEKVRSALGKFEERKNDASGMAGRTVAKYLEEAGVDAEKIREITDTALRDANRGVSLVAKTGDEIEKTYRGAANSIGLMKDKLKGEEYEEYAEKMMTSADRIAKAQEKMMMSDSAIDRGFGWFDFTIEQLGHWWNEFSKNLEHQDWGEAWGNIWKGFMNGFGKLPIASDIWNALFNSIKLEDHIVKGDLGASLGKMGTDLGNWILDGLKNNFLGENSLIGFVGKWLNDGLSSLFGGFDKLLGDSAKLGEGFVKWIQDGLSSFDITKIFGDGSGSGGALKKIDTTRLMNSLFGLIDSTGVGEWFTNSLMPSISEAFNTFMADPIALLGGVVQGSGIGSLLTALFGGEEGVASTWTWIQYNIVQPFMNLPSAIIGYLTQVGQDILTQGSLWVQYGTQQAWNTFNGVIGAISQIPSNVYHYIVNTASSIISGASQWVSNASSKASETVNAVVSQISGLPDKVYNEFMKIADRIRDAISGAVQAATQFGGDIVNAVLGALHIHSPGIIQNKIATEFANIGGRIAENSATVQSEASNFGQAIVNGMDNQMSNVQASASALTDAMNMTQADVVLDQSFVGDYQQDANIIGGINQTMTTDTTLAFSEMSNTVDGSINGIATNVATSYGLMNTNQTTALTTMQNQNKTAYTNLQTQTSTSLNNMRNTTQNVTTQMIGAWNHMKDSIIYSADQLKSQSTAHFNTLSSNIGGFYQKLQNPSMWGAGDKVPTRYYNHSRGQRGIRAVKQTFGVTPQSRGYAGGPSPDTLPERMTLRKLRSLVGSPQLFRGMNLDEEVDVAEFLSMFEGGFGWGDWYGDHFEHIKSTSGEWQMQGPSIMHRIPTGQSFQVKEFYDSTPSISFSSFQSMAEALFSAIPYEFYYNSDAHGSWQAALEAGSCNCYDGASALIALAATCGFSGSMQSGTWNGIPHIFAVINGKKMDTTSWQQRRDWNGVSAGSPPNFKGNTNESKVTNINIDMSNSTFYGEDDFKEKIETIAHEVMEREITTSITVGI